MGRFIAEPLGEQPIGSEGSSRPALRTYFVEVYFTGTPVNISELSGECWGGGGSWSSASLCADVFALNDVPVGEEREATNLNNDNPPVCASKLLDYAHRDFHGLVGDIVSRTVCMH